MGYPKIKYQHITFKVSSVGQAIIIDAETDKLYNTLTGINVLLTDELARFSTLQLDMNGQELFPENFEILRLQFRQHVPFGFDYHTLKEPASGSKLKGTYKDVAGAVSYPYYVTFSLRLENLEPTDTGKIS
jgi:hypothetical protein